MAEKIVEKITSHINSLANQQLKNFLLEHLNLKANNYLSLYTSDQTAGRSPLKSYTDPSQYFSEYSPLAIFYRHAPLILTEQLTSLLLSLPHSEFFAALKANEHYLFNGNEVMEQASGEDQYRLAVHLQQLSGEEIFSILTQQYMVFFSKKKFINIKPFIDIHNEKKTLAFFEIFLKFNTQKILNIFKSKTYFKYEYDFIEIIAQPVTESLALKIIQLLKILPKSQLKKIINNSHSLNKLSKENFLHPIFSFYSVEVVQAMLPLFAEFKATELYALFKMERNLELANQTEAEKKGIQTPLHLAFNRTDQPEIACSLIEILPLNAFLKPISGLAPIHCAIQTNNLKAMQLFLEKFSKIPEKDLKKMRRLAKKHQLTTIFNLCKIYPWRQALEGNNPQLRDLNEEAALLNTRWSNGETLLHMACQKNNLLIVERLIQLGVDIECVDTQGWSPLHLALESGNPNIMAALISHPQITVHIPNPQGVLPFQKLLQQNQYALLQQTIKNCRNQHMSPALESAFAQTLSTLPIVHRSFDFLHEILEKSQRNNSLKELLRASLVQNRDSIRLFILETSDLLASTAHSSMAQFQIFISLQLEVLNNEAPTLEKETARFNLLLFLIGMPVKTMIDILTKCRLTPIQRVHLELTLGQILIKPAIFLNLSVQEQQNICAFMGSSSPTLKSIINIHFQKSDLSLFAPEILQYFANELTFEELLNHSKKRHNPYLLLLTIERACQEKKEDVLIYSLLDLFYGEIESCKNLTQAQQILALFEIIKQPRALQSIRQFLHTKNPEEPLWLALLEALKNGKKPAKDSLWHILLLDYVMDSKNYVRPDYADYLFLILPFTSFSEASTILAALQCAFQNQRDMSPNPLYTWLFKLPLQEESIQLTPFTHQSIALSSQAQKLAKMLNKPSQAPLKKALDELALYLEELADAIINSQFNALPPLDTASLTVVSISVQKSVEIVQQNFAQLYRNKQVNLRESYQLVELLDKQIGKNFLPALHQAFTSLHHLTDKPDNAKAALSPNQRTAINQQLTKGILHHAEQAKLSENLVQWYIQQGHALDSTLWIKTFAQLLMKPSFKILHDKLQTFFLPSCALNLLAKPFINRLKKFSDKKNYSIECLLEHLCTYDKDSLLLLTKLAEQAQLHDFSSLLRYVHTGIEQEWDSRMLINSIDNASIGNIAPWLASQMEQLQFFVTVSHSSQFLLQGFYLAKEDNIARLRTLKAYLQAHQHGFLISAVEQWISSWAAILNVDLFSLEARAFVVNFNLVLAQMDKSSQIALIERFSEDFLTNLLEHCISGMHNTHSEEAQACREILNLISTSTHTGDSVIRNVLKKRLAKEDLNLLGNQQLIVLAEEILTKKDVGNATIDGIWIQRLLTSPRFMAACASPEQLINQYCVLSTCLKQEEFENLTKFHNKLSFAETHHRHLQALEKELLIHNDRREALLAKKERLLKFRAKDAVRALLNQLEENCLELQEKDPTTANIALNNLYRFYNEQLGTLRSDLLFRVANFTYALIMNDKGDLLQSKHTLLQLVERELPHLNFTQAELTRKTSMNLYNQQGKKIGFVDESNHCLTFIHHEPVSLLQKEGIAPGYVLYDKQRTRLGTLQATGLLAHDNLFQHHTSALLVATMPIERLQNTAVLDLLMQDILIENSLDTLYEKSATDPIKQAWVHRQVLQRVAHKRELDKRFLETLFQHHSLEELLELMSNTEHSSLSICLFEAILAHDEMRQQFFSRGLDAHLCKILEHLGAQTLLATYLQKQHPHSWFPQGLSLFAAYAKKTNNPALLNEALKEIQGESEFDALLKTLIKDDCNASILLDFIHNNEQLSVQKASSPASRSLTSFFEKHHLLEAITHLNLNSQWDNNKQYRLLLMIFHQEHARLFPKSEIRFSEKYAWHSAELLLLVDFVKKHYQHGQWDEKQAITQALLGELAFKCANFGQTHLFYDNDGLDRKLTTHSIERNILRTFVLDFKKQISNATQKVQSFFSFQQKQEIEIRHYLEEHQAIVDWGIMEKQSWKHCNKGELPLITAFLINYSGSTENLVKLLHDILNDKALVKNKAFIYSISRLMRLYSHRDFSRVIFTVFQQKIEKNPSFLDSHLYLHMMQFYRQNLGKQKNTFDLLAYFGHQKQYQVVLQCITLFNKGDPLKKSAILERISKEAKTEHYLSTHEKSWFFSLRKAWIRWLTYGNKKPTGFISFYDVEVKNSLFTVPPQVNTPTLSGEVADARLNLVKNTRKLKEKYDRFKMKVQETQVLISDLYKKKVIDKPKNTAISEPENLLTQSALPQPTF